MIPKTTSGSNRQRICSVPRPYIDKLVLLHLPWLFSTILCLLFSWKGRTDIFTWHSDLGAQEHPQTVKFLIDFTAIMHDNERQCETKCSLVELHDFRPSSFFLGPNLDFDLVYYQVMFLLSILYTTSVPSSFFATSSVWPSRSSSLQAVVSFSSCLQFAWAILLLILSIEPSLLLPIRILISLSRWKKRLLLVHRTFNLLLTLYWYNITAYSRRDLFTTSRGSPACCLSYPPFSLIVPGAIKHVISTWFMDGHPTDSEESPFLSPLFLNHCAVQVIII